MAGEKQGMDYYHVRECFPLVEHNRHIHEHIFSHHSMAQAGGQTACGEDNERIEERMHHTILHCGDIALSEVLVLQCEKHEY